jgi:hypothetical protein
MFEPPRPRKNVQQVIINITVKDGSRSTPEGMETLAVIASPQIAYVGRLQKHIGVERGPQCIAELAVSRLLLQISRLFVASWFDNVNFATSWPHAVNLRRLEVSSCGRRERVSDLKALCWGEKGKGRKGRDK